VRSIAVTFGHCVLLRVSRLIRVTKSKFALGFPTQPERGLAFDW
jgi:hypothetical protein